MKLFIAFLLTLFVSLHFLGCLNTTHDTNGTLEEEQIQSANKPKNTMTPYGNALQEEPERHMSPREIWEMRIKKSLAEQKKQREESMQMAMEKAREESERQRELQEAMNREREKILKESRSRSSVTTTQAEGLRLKSDVVVSRSKWKNIYDTPGA